jgi:putative transposase
VEAGTMPEQSLHETTVAGPIQTRLYQAQRLHKACVQPLPVVLLAQTTLRTQAQAQVILCSSDLALPYAPLVDYDRLRCHIELHFREAKQYWGLEDFMHLTPPGVTNAAHLSVCMVNVAYRLRTDRHARAPD